ncbi:MAG TPA: DNA polymerase IV [Bacteroidales bacterium]|nr:DNA polymerase IV [Bacteroidales bacterium]HOK99122.1 DNA polymerase IV [Bacteroidales bacterium]HPO66015.1 DNA polymerase IV [Bacteroidales bacterium]
MIIHMDLDTFFVSVERLSNPRLLGIPVVVGGTGNKGVVASCSYEARQYGIHAGMPIRDARVLCREAVFLPGNMELYSQYSHWVADIIAESAPAYEQASIDEFYIDATGLDKYFEAAAWAHHLRRKIFQRTGLPISLGMSVSKAVAKIATDIAKPNGEKYVFPHEVIPFLKPLPVSAMPGVGKKTNQLLQLLGIRTIGDLQRTSPEFLSRLLGKNGLTLWERAHGIDPTPVLTHYEQQSMSVERTLAQSTSDVRILQAELTAMVEHLAFRLRQMGKLTACVSVKIRYTDFNTYLMHKRIPFTVFDHVLIAEAKELFRQLYREGMEVRLLGVGLSRLIKGYMQLSLFENMPKWVQLYTTLDKIRKRHGEHVIHRGNSSILPPAVPNGYHIRSPD